MFYKCYSCCIIEGKILLGSRDEGGIASKIVHQPRGDVIQWRIPLKRREYVLPRGDTQEVYLSHYQSQKSIIPRRRPQQRGDFYPSRGEAYVMKRAGKQPQGYVSQGVRSLRGREYFLARDHLP